MTGKCKEQESLIMDLEMKEESYSEIAATNHILQQQVRGERSIHALNTLQLIWVFSHCEKTHIKCKQLNCLKLIPLRIKYCHCDVMMTCLQKCLKENNQLCLYIYKRKTKLKSTCEYNI